MENKKKIAFFDAKQYDIESFNTLCSGYIKYAYANLLLRPTLPLIWYNWLKPNLSASKIIKVLALGISIPVSIIVVHIKISYS